MSELEPTRVILSSEDLINLSKDQLIGRKTTSFNIPILLISFI